MSGIEIKYARQEDCIALSGIIAEVIQAIPYYNDLAKSSEIAKFGAAALQVKIEEDKSSVILAVAGGQIVGFSLSSFDDYTVWLEWFGVIRQYRGQGIANLLLKALDSTATPRNCHKIWCDCRTSNEASIHILSAHGYRQLVSLSNHWYGQDFILWEKYAGKPGLPDDGGA